MRLCAALVGLALLLFASEALADEDEEGEETGVERFYPIVTRRPVVEREIEVEVEHTKGRDGRETDLAAALELPILPRWQVELEVPFVIADPRHGDTEAGAGDLALENKILLYHAPEHDLRVAAGATLVMPSGSEDPVLGGDLAVEPFLTAGAAVGPLAAIGEASYEWTLDPVHEERVSTGLALAWSVTDWLTPFGEVRTVTPTHGAERASQAYLVPGLNLHPLPGVTTSVGVQLPVTGARDFDHQVRGLVVWEF
jgi:hypothetical protein